MTAVFCSSGLRAGYLLFCIFPAGPREHRFHRSGELHQLGGAPWAAAGPVQTGHAVSPGPEQWRGTGLLPGAHRAGEWKNQMHTHTHTHIIHTRLQRELHETFHVLQHRDKFPHVHPLLLDFRKGYRIDSDRASKLHSGENWLRHSGRCPAKRGSIFPVNVSVNPDT